MANDAVCAAAAANRDVSSNRPGPTQDCSDVVHLAVFFDGTGNNWKEDELAEKWSNVARIFFGATSEPAKSIYRIYISGVGTPYNGKPTNWIEKADVWREDKVQGMGFGGGGERRLAQGDDTVNERLRDLLITNAEKYGGVVAKYAAAGSDKSFEEINKFLAPYNLIKVINVSVFGFSRGAALARAFTNRMLEACATVKGERRYHGFVLNMNFLGIFDTVASFGVPSKNIQLFSERDLIVSTEVKRCVHYVAAHEVRFAFPVDLIRKDGKLAGAGWIEKAYPGVHSDVGGGYGPNDQGIDNNAARIPLRDMMREAVLGGVRVAPLDQIKKSQPGLFKKRFECRPETERAFDKYMAACGSLSGTIEQQMTAHLKVYYSASGTMHRSGIESPGERSRDASKYKYLGPKGMAWEISKYRTAAKLGQWVRFSSSGNPITAYAQYVKPQEWQIAAWDKAASPDVVAFVSKFIHDSKVDFIGNLIEPFSYFKARGVEESTKGVFRDGGNWLKANSAVVGAKVEETIDDGKAQAKRAVDATKRAAEASANSAKQALLDAKRGAERANAALDREIEQAAKSAERAYNDSVKRAQEMAAAAKRKLEAAQAFSDRKAAEAKKALGDAYDETKATGANVLQSGKESLNEVGADIERIYDKGTTWIKRTVIDIRD